MRGYKFRNFIDGHMSKFGQRIEFNGRARFWVQYGLWGLTIMRSWSDHSLTILFSLNNWHWWSEIGQGGRRVRWRGPLLFCPMESEHSRHFINHSDGTSTEFKTREDREIWVEEHKRLTGRGVKHPWYWERANKPGLGK